MLTRRGEHRAAGVRDPARRARPVDGAGSRAAGALEADRHRSRVRPAHRGAVSRLHPRDPCRLSERVRRLHGHRRVPGRLARARPRARAPGLGRRCTDHRRRNRHQDRQPSQPDVRDQARSRPLEPHALPELHRHPLPARARRGQRLRVVFSRRRPLLRPDAARCPPATDHHGLRRARHQLPVVIGDQRRPPPEQGGLRRRPARAPRSRTGDRAPNWSRSAPNRPTPAATASWTSRGSCPTRARSTRPS